MHFALEEVGSIANTTLTDDQSRINPVWLAESPDLQRKH
jgi:hypothetical protein